MTEQLSNGSRISFAEQLRQFLRRNLNWFLVSGLALLLLQDIFGTHGVLAMRRTQQQAAEIRKEINQLDTENRRLLDRVKALKTDPATIERIAREENGLARPGEYIFKTQPRRGEGVGVPPASEPPAKR
ncbi:MAG TPA: septum formation initiator family protein [Candidatus Limnocylindria bacterium]|nr:septum formation initiator family protein [Candidatus Limnocylindria bacterium]